jgi:hypothetical protein
MHRAQMAVVTVAVVAAASRSKNSGQRKYRNYDDRKSFLNALSH